MDIRPRIANRRNVSTGKTEISTDKKNNPLIKPLGLGKVPRTEACISNELGVSSAAGLNIVTTIPTTAKMSKNVGSNSSVVGSRVSCIVPSASIVTTTNSRSSYCAAGTRVITTIPISKPGTVSRPISLTRPKGPYTLSIPSNFTGKSARIIATPPTVRTKTDTDVPSSPLTTSSRLPCTLSKDTSLSIPSNTKASNDSTSNKDDDRSNYYAAGSTVIKFSNVSAAINKDGQQNNYDATVSSNGAKGINRKDQRSSSFATGSITTKANISTVISKGDHRPSSSAVESKVSCLITVPPASVNRNTGPVIHISNQPRSAMVTTIAPDKVCTSLVGSKFTRIATVPVITSKTTNSADIPKVVGVIAPFPVVSANTNTSISANSSSNGSKIAGNFTGISNKASASGINDHSTSAVGSKFTCTITNTSASIIRSRESALRTRVSYITTKAPILSPVINTNNKAVSSLGSNATLSNNNEWNKNTSNSTKSRESTFTINAAVSSENSNASTILQSPSLLKSKITNVPKSSGVSNSKLVNTEVVTSTATGTNTKPTYSSKFRTVNIVTSISSAGNIRANSSSGSKDASTNYTRSPIIIMSPTTSSSNSSPGCRKTVSTIGTNSIVSSSTSTTVSSSFGSVVSNAKIITPSQCPVTNSYIRPSYSLSSLNVGFSSESKVSTVFTTTSFIAVSSVNGNTCNQPGAVSVVPSISNTITAVSAMSSTNVSSRSSLTGTNAVKLSDNVDISSSLFTINSSYLKQSIPPATINSATKRTLASSKSVKFTSDEEKSKNIDKVIEDVVTASANFILERENCIPAEQAEEQQNFTDEKQLKAVKTTGRKSRPKQKKVTDPNRVPNKRAKKVLNDEIITSAIIKEFKLHCVTSTSDEKLLEPDKCITTSPIRVPYTATDDLVSKIKDTAANDHQGFNYGVNIVKLTPDPKDHVRKLNTGIKRVENIGFVPNNSNVKTSITTDFENQNRRIFVNNRKVVETGIKHFENQDVVINNRKVKTGINQVENDVGESSYAKIFLRSRGNRSRIIRWRLNNEKFPPVLKQLDSYLRVVENTYSDLYPLGFEASDSDTEFEDERGVCQASSLTNLSGAVGFEKSKKNCDSYYRDICDQLGQVKTSKRLYHGLPKSFALILICAAKEFPNETADLLSYHDNRAQKNLAISTEICSVNQCNKLAVPCTKLCAQHISKNRRQILFDRCHIQDDKSGTQCSKPAMRMDHERPICFDHDEPPFEFADIPFHSTVNIISDEEEETDGDRKVKLKDAKRPNLLIDRKKVQIDDDNNPVVSDFDTLFHISDDQSDLRANQIDSKFSNIGDVGRGGNESKNSMDIDNKQHTMEFLLYPDDESDTIFNKRNTNDTDFLSINYDNEENRTLKLDDSNVDDSMDFLYSEVKDDVVNGNEINSMDILFNNGPKSSVTGITKQGNNIGMKYNEETNVSKQNSSLFDDKPNNIMEDSMDFMFKNETSNSIINNTPNGIADSMDFLENDDAQNGMDFLFNNEIKAISRHGIDKPSKRVGYKKRNSTHMKEMLSSRFLNDDDFLSNSDANFGTALPNNYFTSTDSLKNGLGNDYLNDEYLYSANEQQDYSNSKGDIPNNSLLNNFVTDSIDLTADVMLENQDISSYIQVEDVIEEVEVMDSNLCTNLVTSQMSTNLVNHETIPTVFDTFSPVDFNDFFSEEIRQNRWKETEELERAIKAVDNDMQNFTQTEGIDPSTFLEEIQSTDYPYESNFSFSPLSLSSQFNNSTNIE